VIRTHRHAGPLIILDEIEKAGTGRHNGNLYDVLHGLLERETAARWHDPYIDAPCDLSHISWIMTANTIEPVPKSLRDRCRCIRFPEPGPEHLAVLAQRLLAEKYRDKGFDPKWALRIPPAAAVCLIVALAG
jgi:ATP-dependent Lon protease